jgi:penicillin-binding protein 1A
VPDLVAGVWTGAEDRSVHFYSTSDGQGANMALPIWALFMRKIYDDKTIQLNRGDFEKPRTPLTIELNCKDYNEENWEENQNNNINFDNTP